MQSLLNSLEHAFNEGHIDAFRYTLGEPRVKEYIPQLMTTTTAVGYYPDFMIVQAVRLQKWPFAYALLKHGADVMCAGRHGLTALHWAAYYRNVPMIQALLKRNPDCVHVVSEHVPEGVLHLNLDLVGTGFTALHLVCTERGCGPSEKRDACIETLVLAGARLDAACQLRDRTHMYAPFDFIHCKLEHALQRSAAAVERLQTANAQRMQVVLPFLYEIRDMGTLVDAYAPVQIVSTVASGEEDDTLMNWTSLFVFMLLLLIYLFYVVMQIK